MNAVRAIIPQPPHFSYKGPSMFCPKCGNTLAIDQNFCVQCGSAVSQSTGTSGAAVQAARQQPVVQKKSGINPMVLISLLLALIAVFILHPWAAAVAVVSIAANWIL